MSPQKVIYERAGMFSEVLRASRTHYDQALPGECGLFTYQWAIFILTLSASCATPSYPH